MVGPGRQENLPPGYLGAAVARAGYAPRFVAFNRRKDKDLCVSTIRRCAPDLVGISIPFQFAVMDTLALISALRHSGYRGHITCGGHVPTFCFESLLRDAPGLDSVERHEGEATLAALAEALRQNRALDGIPGLVSRCADGLVGAESTAPLVDVDGLATPLRRSTLFEIGGVPITFMLTSRGCIGDCHYCSIRAFNKSADGPRYRLRDPERVAEEAARRMGARHLFLGVAEHTGAAGPVTYRWKTESGTLSDTHLGGAVWHLPKDPGVHAIQLIVDDGNAVAVTTFRYQHQAA